MKTSAFSNLIGEKIAHDSVTVVDDGTIDSRRGSLSIDDEHRAAKSTFEWSEKESLKMIDIFTEKCAQSPLIKEKKKWNKYIIKKHIMSQLANRSDWILDAEEAVHYRFADGVLGDRKFPTIDSLKKNKR